jgi:hypothetical protein
MNNRCIPFNALYKRGKESIKLTELITAMRELCIIISTGNNTR